VQARVAPPGDAALPADEALKPVTEAVRAVLGVLTSRQQERSPLPGREQGAG
jgi:hypothetical protein